MGRPKLLDLFCGAGGTSMGYYLAGFEVEGVDIKPQPHYPFKFYQADALEYPLKGYDAYHASPPCQAYSSVTNRQPKRQQENMRLLHPDLVLPTRQRLISLGKPYVIENVIGARRELIEPFMLCGTMFGLRFFKHRLFESNVFMLAPKHSKHDGRVGDGYYVSPIGNTYKKIGLVKDWQEAMEIDWMTVKELSQAIPPAYTEYIGKHLLQLIDGK